MSIFYGTSGDVRENLGNPTETEVSVSMLNFGRKKATALIDAILEYTYPSKIPFTASGDVPALISSLTDDFAVYYIKRSLHRGVAPLSAEIKKEFYEEPMKILDKIKDREIDLPELSSGLESQIDANRAEYTPIFDVDETEEHVVDPDLLEDISDKRA